MPAVPNEAFGVFLSSSPPAITAATCAGCFLWDGSGLQPLASRRAGARNRLSPARFVSQGDSVEGDVLGGYSTTGDRSDSKFDYDGLFSRNSALLPTASLLPAPCEPRPVRSVGSRLKKRVTFADHRGFDLEAVKVIQEDPDSPPPGLCCRPAETSAPSPQPPRSSGGAGAIDLKSAVTPRQLGFRTDFPQPVSNYAAFKARLHARCVAVENVTVDPVAPYLVSVTVKVKNVSFEKHVFIRATRNGWKGHRDFAAAYHSSTPECFGPAASAAGNAGGSASLPLPPIETSLYDTFLLKADLAASLDATGFVSPIEFAVCFRAADGVEYWDNHDGSNYRLVMEYDLACASNDRSGSLSCPACPEPDHAADSVAAVRDSWTSFAAWRTGSPEVPYW